MYGMFSFQKFRWLGLLLLLGWMVLAEGCQCVIIIPPAEYLPCNLVVKPEKLEMGTVPAGGVVQKLVTVTNESNRMCPLSTLRFDSIEPQGHAAFRLGKPMKFPVELGPNQSVVLPIQFAPRRHNQNFKSTLILNEEDEPPLRQEVSLLGDTQGSCLEVTPELLSLGDNTLTCGSGLEEVQLKHNGEPGCPAEIVVSSVSFTRTTSSEFQLVNLPNIPLTLRPFETAKVNVQYVPENQGLDEGTLQVYTVRSAAIPINVRLLGRGVAAPSQTDTFRTEESKRVDILFVIDNSCSMWQEQKALTDNFGSFMQWAIKLKADYQIGVITTDVDGKEAGCLRGSDPIITPQTKDPIATFWNNVIVGTGGSSNEKGLDAAFKALSKENLEGCNKGFFRKDASLSLIFISDEGDQSEEPVHIYTKFFRSLKEKPFTVQASAVVGPEREGCSSPFGDAQQAPRYHQIVEELRGIVASICDSDWAETLSQLGYTNFGYAPEFNLSKKPVASTIVVRVNNLIVPRNNETGWYYKEYSNSVRFTGPATPPIPATITIQYQLHCKQGG